jgi:hypothetical protein
MPAPQMAAPIKFNEPSLIGVYHLSEIEANKPTEWSSIVYHRYAFPHLLSFIHKISVRANASYEERWCKKPNERKQTLCIVLTHRMVWHFFAVAVALKLSLLRRVRVAKM